MKLPKNYFENLSTSKYKEYLKLLPSMQHDNTRIITTLIFTFAAMTFFGIFAINPTLTTINELQKKLTDSEFVNEQLKVKISNLSALQGEYTRLTPDLPIVMDAIPANPQAPQLLGQIQKLAQQSKLQILSLRVSEVQLTSSLPSPPNGSSFIFNLEAEGEYQSMIQFVTTLSRFNRIVVIDSLAINKDPRQGALTLTLRGRQYFKNN